MEKKAYSAFELLKKAMRPLERDNRSFSAHCLRRQLQVPRAMSRLSSPVDPGARRASSAPQLAFSSSNHALPLRQPPHVALFPLSAGPISPCVGLDRWRLGVNSNQRDTAYERTVNSPQRLGEQYPIASCLYGHLSPLRHVPSGPIRSGTEQRTQSKGSCRIPSPDRYPRTQV